MEERNFYILSYKDPMDGKVVSLKAKTISDSNLGLSFIKISDFLFNTENLSVINPEEEKLQKKLEHTKSLHLSIYSILSIEEVGKTNVGLSFEKNKANLVVFPSSPTKV